MCAAILLKVFSVKYTILASYNSMVENCASEGGANSFFNQAKLQRTILLFFHFYLSNLAEDTNEGLMGD